MDRVADPRICVDQGVLSQTALISWNAVYNRIHFSIQELWVDGLSIRWHKIPFSPSWNGPLLSFDCFCSIWTLSVFALSDSQHSLRLLELVNTGEIGDGEVFSDPISLLSYLIVWRCNGWVVQPDCRDQPRITCDWGELSVINSYHFSIDRLVAANTSFDRRIQVYDQRFRSFCCSPTWIASDE
jgi:hypothetical protein